MRAAGRRFEGDRKLKVAVVGGGPSGACAAETLAKAGIETYMIERKLDNCKPCGGAIPLCMVGEFDLPMEIIDRKVTKMKMISPSNREVDVGQTLKPNEYSGMTRREILDDYLRVRAGVGRPPGRMAVADFVLKRFSKLEQPDVPFLVQDAADAVELLLQHGLEIAQNQVHSA